MMLIGDEVAERIVGEVGIQAWIDHEIGVDGHEQGVAVGRRPRDLCRRQPAIGARLVLDDHRLPHGFAQTIREAARDQVDRAACRLRQDEANGLAMGTARRRDARTAVRLATTEKHATAIAVMARGMPILSKLFVSEIERFAVQSVATWLRHPHVPQ